MTYLGANLLEFRVEPLWEDSEFCLYRLRGASEEERVLCLLPVSPRPAPRTVGRLQQEMSLAPLLEPDWAARPQALVTVRERPALLLEDQGRQPMRLEGPLELVTLLQLGLELTKALGGVHGAGLLHKDIKPTHVLVDEQNTVRLTGFGVAAELRRERHQADPPEDLAGTLAYMAPEQTGRMNRSIDARSDLYSLGVCLYQMASGRLPFQARDPLEWVHCHVARQPLPLKEVPKTLGAIILKLLAKEPESRYQTAAGLEADLKKCLKQQLAGGAVGNFRLGRRDTNDRLLLTEVVCGRQAEIALLTETLERVTSRGSAELVLVSGPSGGGKSTVMGELERRLTGTGSIYASGKFDQYQQHVPFSTLFQAFGKLLRQLLAENEETLACWRQRLGAALDGQGALLTHLIPELEWVLGPQPAVGEVPPQQAHRRFRLVLKRLLAGFASREHPLVLFLDDLQWMDSATLELLEELLAKPELEHLMLVGAYRTNEMPALTLETLKGGGLPVQEISLEPLAEVDVALLVELSLQSRDTAELASLVHERTGGNPFFVHQFLTQLAQDRSLDFRDGRWRWNPDEIQARPYTLNMGDLMVARLATLSREARTALSGLACLGGSVSLTLARLVLDEAHLDEAAKAGLLLAHKDRYVFLHDRVREAAYSVIPEEQRASWHLNLAELLTRSLDGPMMEEAIFEVAHQWSRAEPVRDPESVARLYLQAALRAKRSCAYKSALVYLSWAQTLVGPASPLAFKLDLERAECEFLTGELELAQERLAGLAATTEDRLARGLVTRLWMGVHITLDRSDLALDVCLDYLRDLGIDWSRHPSDHEVEAEFEALFSRLAGRPIVDLVELPLLSDPCWNTVLDLLCEAFPPALFTDYNLLCLVLGRIVNISLEHGNGPGSCLGYVHLGLVLGPRFAKHEAAYQFGELGLSLVDRPGFERLAARVYQGFGNFVVPWKHHVREGEFHLRRALELANSNGDLTYAAYLQFILLSQLLARALPLSDLHQFGDQAVAFARASRFGLVVAMLGVQLALIKTLRGLTPQFGSFDDESFDEAETEAYLEANPNLALPACYYWIHKLQARFYAGDFEGAAQAVDRARPLLWTSPAFLRLSDYHFFAGLTRAARGELELMTEHQQQMQVWATNCRSNFGHRAALLAAEMARLEGRIAEAESAFEQAATDARREEFWQDEGLACEAAARHYRERDLHSIAEACLENARHAFGRWGASAKLRQLGGQAEIEQSGSEMRQFDLATVVKMSQALSQELVLEDLFKRLLALAVENAGATRGMLLSPSGEVLAQAKTGANGLRVRLRGSTRYPLGLTRYSARTREVVMLDDASSSHSFRNDDYFRKHRRGSMLCLPLLKQTSLVGLLYLENSLTSYSFTPGRLDALGILASQAAISLENARLYDELRRTEAYLGEAQRLSQTGSFGWNLQTGELVWSDQTYRIFGFRQGRTPTLERVLERVHPDDRGLVRAAIEQAAAEGVGFEVDHRLMLPDGQVKHLRVVSQPTSQRHILVGAVQDVTQRHLQEEALRASEEQARIAEQRRLEAVTQERTRMARDMHDTLAQGFTGVILQLEAGADALSRGLSSEVEHHLTRAAAMARAGLQEARRSVHALRPRALEEGLVEALRALLESMDAGGMRTRLSVSGVPSALPEAWDESLLRIGQELLTNSAKYARAQHFQVHLQFDDTEVRLEAADDGRGFELSAVHDGFGLIGIQERVSQLGGELKIDSSPGMGTRVGVVLRHPPKE